MNPALNRALHLCAYGIATAILAGGAAYGVRQWLQPPQPPVQTTSKLSGRVIIMSGAPAAPPAAAANPQPQPDSARPAEDSAAEEQTQAEAQDRATYSALQKNCYAAAEGNRNGDYPAMQQDACQRFVRFAADHGWDTGPLPASVQAQPDNPGEAAETGAAVPSATEGTADATPLGTPAATDPSRVIVVERLVPGFRQGLARGTLLAPAPGDNRQSQPQTLPVPRPPPPPVERGPQRPPSSKLAPSPGRQE